MDITTGMTVIVLGAGMLCFLVISIAWTFKLYTKAGESWWKALIPVYNYYVLGTIAKEKTLGIIMAIIFVLSGIIGWQLAVVEAEVKTSMEQLIEEGIVEVSSYDEYYDMDVDAQIEIDNNLLEGKYGQGDLVEAFRKADDSLSIVAFFYFLLSVASFVIWCFFSVSLARVFGQDKWFIVGMALAPFIFAPILGGIDSIKYLGNKEKKKK